MPTRLNDLFTYILLIGVLVLAFLGIHGCAASAPPPLNDTDRIPTSAAVFLQAGDGRCSAVAIADHYLLTAAHCVKTGPFTIYAFPGVEGTATLVAIHPDRDLARLHTPLKLTAQARIARDLPRSGDLLIQAGFGCIEDLFVAAGVYLGQGPLGGLISTIPVCGGDSGGPVFNKYGDLVGVVHGRNIDIPVSVATDARGRF